MYKRRLNSPRTAARPVAFRFNTMSHHRPRLRLLLAAALLLAPVHGHEHHTDMIADGEGISPDPIDGVLWAHILLQTLAWGILVPTGLVLGVGSLYISSTPGLTTQSAWLKIAAPGLGRFFSSSGLNSFRIDYQIAMACPGPSPRFRPRRRRILPRTRP